jgi:hypothetical protein
MKVSDQLHAPVAIIPSTYWIRRFVDPRAGLEAVAKIIFASDRNRTPYSSVRNLVSVPEAVRYRQYKLIRSCYLEL